MIRWYPARRQPRRANARRPGLLRDARGATMIEYLIIVVVIALVAASAFSKFDGAVRTALKSEPEKATKLDGDDGQRNGPTAAELAEAVAYAYANQAIGGEHDRDAANHVSQHSNHGAREAPPDKIGVRSPPRDPGGPPPRDPGGPPPRDPDGPAPGDPHRPPPPDPVSPTPGDPHRPPPPDPGGPLPGDPHRLPPGAPPNPLPRDPNSTPRDPGSPSPPKPGSPPLPGPNTPPPSGTNDPPPRDPGAPGPPSRPGPTTPESPDGGLFAGCTGDRCTGENGSNCFVAGTPVLTASGPQPIEAVRAGDLVVSRDEATGETALRPVVRTFVRPAESLVDVELRAPGGAETIRSTPEHPYRSAERGWISAGALRAGERLLDARGGELRVAQIERLDAQAPVYNFEVAGTHTYFVGALGAWVHNDCSKDEAAAAVNEAIDRANQEIRDKNQQMPAMTPEERARKNARIDEKIRQVRAGEGEYEEYDDDEKAEEIESLEGKRPRDPIPEIEPIGSLDAAADRPPLSCKDVSCTNFAGYLLEANGGDGPAHTGPIAPGDFVHVHIDSPANPNLEHSFNVYFDDQGNAYIVQAFVNHSVPVVTRMSQSEFNRRLELVKSGQPGWQQAYQELFHVDPNTLGVNDPKAGMNARLTDPPPTNAGGDSSAPPPAAPPTVDQVIAPPPGAADAQDAEDALDDGADALSSGCCGGACKCVTM